MAVYTAPKELYIEQLIPFACPPYIARRLWTETINFSSQDELGRLLAVINQQGATGPYSCCGSSVFGGSLGMWLRASKTPSRTTPNRLLEYFS